MALFAIGSEGQDVQCVIDLIGCDYEVGVSEFVGLRRDKF